MKHGYLIAKNSAAKEFFISSSAYDRPQWKALNEATVYATAELADNAAKKLYRNGSYSAKIVSLDEMNLDIAPIDPVGGELPPEELDDELDGDMEGGEEGLDGDDEEGDGEDEMVAGEQTDDEIDPELSADSDEGGLGEFDDDLENEEGYEGDLDDEDPDLDDEDTDLKMDDDGEEEFGDEEGLDDEGMDEEGMDDELDLNGGPDENEQEADPQFDSRRLGMAQLSPMGGPRRMGRMGETADQPLAQDLDAKVKVPSNVSSELSAAIADFKKQAEYSKNSDEARSSFCLTAVDAMETLQSELSKGTVEGLKMAAVKLSSFMSPITTLIPTLVTKFVYSGGVKPTLKEIFNTKLRSVK